MKAILVVVLLFLSAALGVSVTWQFLNPTGDVIKGVDAPTAVVFPLTSQIYVFGGQTGNFSGQVDTPSNLLHQYSVPENHVTLLHPSGTLPAPRTFHSSWSEGLDTLYVAGGIYYDYFFTNITVYNDFWKYSILANRWTQVIPTGAVFPALASFVAERGPDGSVYIFGGVDASFVAHGSLYRLDTEHNTLTLLTPSGATPAARYHAYHAQTEDGFFVTGGVGTDQLYIEDYWFFHFATQTWTQRPIPTGPRPNNRTHGVTGRVGDHFLLALGDLVGGVNCPGIIFQQNPVNDTWIYSFARNTFEQVFPPFAPFLKYSGDVAFGTNVYAFGGYSFNVPTCTQTYNNNILRAHFNDFYFK